MPDTLSGCKKDRLPAVFFYAFPPETRHLSQTGKSGGEISAHRAVIPPLTSVPGNKPPQSGLFLPVSVSRTHDMPGFFPFPGEAGAGSRSHPGGLLCPAGCLFRCGHRQEKPDNIRTTAYS